MTSIEDTSWDIEQYRTKFESQEHWDLKEEFIVAHKERFPEKRLICLAQVYANIQLLGCRYPEKVMQQVAVLSKELGKKYQENKKKRLQRTFVKASDAASAKFRAKLSESPACEDNILDVNVPSTSGSSSSQGPSKLTSEHSENLKAEPENNKIDARKILLGKAFQEVFSHCHPLARFIIIFQESTIACPIQVLVQSTKFNQAKLEFFFRPLPKNKFCQIKLNRIEMGFGCGRMKKDAKRVAARMTVKMLHNMCFAIEILEHKEKYEDISVNYLKQSSRFIQRGNVCKNKMRENIGARLLRMMGWDGGPIGTTHDGFIDMMNAKAVIGRRGLGLKNDDWTCKNFKKNVRKVLQNYVQEDTTGDLFFSSELSNEQRKEIHLMAQSDPFDKILRTRSYGSGDERYLIVSKLFTPRTLLQRIIEQGGETDKYKLHIPASVPFTCTRNNSESFVTNFWPMCMPMLTNKQS